MALVGSTQISVTKQPEREAALTHPNSAALISTPPRAYRPVSSILDMINCIQYPYCLDVTACHR